jgi:nicotinate-nucleotide adenylyltransferase
MKISLYFGSFNPIHIGHLAIANYFVENQECDQVWFVVSPHNPLKQKASLLEDYHRLSMVKIAVDDNPKFRASDIEFGMEEPNYTVKTLVVLREKYPTHEFSIIMGEDNLRNFHKWFNYEYILKNHSVFVYPRIGTAKDEVVLVAKEEIKNHPAVHFCADLPVMAISSSYIRSEIKEGKVPKYLLTPKVLEYIDEMGFYKK